MTDKQRQAYEWAKNQDYPSVAARYAKELSGLVDDLQAALRAQQQPNEPLTLELQNRNLRNIVLCRLKGLEYQYTQAHSVMTENVADSICQGIERFLARKEREEPPTGWIGVKDRLPTDEDEMVLAIVSGKPCENFTLDGAYELATYIEREGWIVEQYPEWETPEVTFWMPLPDPPQVQNDLQ